MKTTIIATLLIVGMLIPSKADDASKDLWLKLSADVQNLSYQMLHLNPTGAIDPGALAEDMKPIEVVLNKLVKKGDLIEKTVRLRPWSKIGDNGMMQIQEFVAKLAKDHGQFVAMFLMDMGPNRQFEQEQNPDGPVDLRLRLPTERLKEFEKLAADQKLLTEKTAQQNGGEQPATRSKSE